MSCFLAQNREWHAPRVLVFDLRSTPPIAKAVEELSALHLRRFESCVLHGQAVYRACEQ